MQMSQKRLVSTLLDPVVDGGGSAKAARKCVIRAAKACDQCHHRKQRCNGLVPCSRCVKGSRECTMKRASMVLVHHGGGDLENNSNESQGQSPSSSSDAGCIVPSQMSFAPERRQLSLLDESAKNFLLLKYHEHYEPLLPMMVLRRNASSLEQSIAEMVRTDVALAMAARGCGFRELADCLINRAKTVSKDIFDQPGENNCIAFMHLAFYYVGEDSFLSRHYQHIAVGLDDSQGNSSDPSQALERLFGRVCHGDLLLAATTILPVVKRCLGLCGDTIRLIAMGLKEFDPQGTLYPAGIPFNTAGFCKNLESKEYAELDEAMVACEPVLARLESVSLKITFTAVTMLCRGHIAMRSGLVDKARQLATICLECIAPNIQFCSGRYFPLVMSLAELVVELADDSLSKRLLQALSVLASIYPAGRLILQTVSKLMTDPTWLRTPMISFSACSSPSVLSVSSAPSPSSSSSPTASLASASNATNASITAFAPVPFPVSHHSSNSIPHPSNTNTNTTMPRQDDTLQCSPFVVTWDDSNEAVYGMLPL